MGKKHYQLDNFICPECGTEHNRDINTSINIKNYALGQLKTINTVGTTEI